MHVHLKIQTLVFTLESSSNLNLSAKNSIVVNIDGVEEGRITSDGINLRIIDTTINDTPIGNSGPSTGTFTEVTQKIMAQHQTMLYKSLM